MKRITTTSIATLIAIMGLNGCVDDHNLRYSTANQDVAKLKLEEKVVRDYNKAQAEASKKMIHLNIRNKWAYSVVKTIAKRYKLALDKTFIPSKEYKVSARGDYSFSGVLEMIYRQTGVNYKIEDGILQVVNKELVDEYTPARSCTKGNSFSISLKDIPIQKVFSILIKDGYNVIYDTKYYDLNGNNPSLSPFHNVNFYYKGCSKKEAIKKFAKANDLNVVFNGKDVYVRDYQTIEIDIPSPFSTKYASTSSRIGETQASGGLNYTDSSNPKKEMIDLIKSSMSEKGKAYLSSKGYLIITDTPSSIKNIKKFLKKELEAQQNIEMEITIISVELNDNYKSGVDWSAVFDNLGKDLGIRNLNMGLSQTLDDSGALTLNGIIDNKNQLLQFLGEYGKSKVVKTYRVNTRSGTISSLKSVDVIPYVTTTTTTTDGISESNDEAKSTESGIVLNIKPTYSKGYVNMNIDASLSQYLGDKDVKDGYMLPMQTDNKVQTVITTKVGTTAILTGLRLKSKKLNFAGLPYGHKASIFSTFSGKNDDEIESKEYLIFITPKRIFR